MSDAFERVRDALVTAGASFRDNRQSHFMATCPAHADKNPSLGVDDSGDHVLLRCYAGCQNDEVVAALGLDFKDLFDSEPESSTGQKHLVRTYVYEAANGSPWILVDRWFPKTFTQRLPGTEPGERSSLKGRVPVLYHLPKLVSALQGGADKVWLVEGEKDVEAMERQGLLATTTLAGAGKWRDEYTSFLKQFSTVYIVVDQDQIKEDGTLGAGQQHAHAARTALRAEGVAVRLVAPAVGKDASDHFAGGYGPDDFITEPTAYSRPRGLKASDLMTHEFEPVTWAIEGLLPTGLAILAAPPKVGKSWIVQDCGLAVAMGGRAMGHLRTTQGSVLLLAREDTYRRLQSRTALILGRGEAPAALEMIPSEQEWIGGEQGLANMTEWAEECGDPRLVIIDTLARVEPDMGEERRGGAYAANYTMMARYKRWADTHNCAVLMVHHDRKQSASATGSTEDPFTRISGTRGITGAVDTMWFLEVERGTGQGILHVTGRDVAEQALEVHKVGPLWQCTSMPEMT